MVAISNTGSPVFFSSFMIFVLNNNTSRMQYYFLHLDLTVSLNLLLCTRQILGAICSLTGLQIRPVVSYTVFSINAHLCETSIQKMPHCRPKITFPHCTTCHIIVPFPTAVNFTASTNSIFTRLQQTARCQFRAPTKSCPMVYSFKKFHKNCSTTLCIIKQTDRHTNIPTNKQTKAKTQPPWTR